MDYRFKPNLNTYGEREKYYVRLKDIFTVLCLITPATNWLLPFVRKYVKGSIYYIKETK